MPFYADLKPDGIERTILNGIATGKGAADIVRDMGEELAAAKQKHGIGILKNKQQLVKALEKTAGEELAEKAKKEALEIA